MTLFDCYIAIDWSAADKRTVGKDSIWISVRWREDGAAKSLVQNIGTRSEAVERLRELFREGLGKGHRIFAGFDFAFGYPAGFAEALTGTGGWRTVWERLASDISDADDNRSNRFDVASRYNEAFGVERFWGKPHQHKDRYPNLPAAKPYGGGLLDRRFVESRMPGAKSVFQMAYNGAVGSQTMLGIARLETLRNEFDLRVWPFETQFADDLPVAPSIVAAEIYPTLALRRAPEGEIKDRAQVLAMTKLLATADREGRLGALLSPPPGSTEADRARMLSEEGAIVGAGRL